jgi:uncharacterized protein with PIN domain
VDVRFLIDEHIDHSIATTLRLRVYDVLTLTDAKLLGADDLQAILPFALSQNRVLVTRDADFLAMHAQGDAHAGLVHWHGKRRIVKQAIQYLLQLARKETSENMAGAVRFIKSHYP